MFFVYFISNRHLTVYMSFVINIYFIVDLLKCANTNVVVSVCVHTCVCVGMLVYVRVFLCACMRACVSLCLHKCVCVTYYTTVRRTVNVLHMPISYVWPYQIYISITLISLIISANRLY